MHAHRCYTEKIRNEWPFWDDLHAIWRELPNYNPVGISNAEGGQNHSEQAAHLFQTKTPSSEQQPDHQKGPDSDISDEQSSDKDKGHNDSGLDAFSRDASQDWDYDAPDRSMTSSAMGSEDVTVAGDEGEAVEKAEQLNVDPPPAKVHAHSYPILIES